MIKSGLACRSGEKGLCLGCNKVKKIGCVGQGLCSNCYMKSHPNYKLYNRKRNLKVKFNLSLEEFEMLSIKQNNKCAICGLQDKLYVDHDHKTGKIRELLCNCCNNGLGRFYDNVEVLQKAIDYLNKHKMEEV